MREGSQECTLLTPEKEETHAIIRDYTSFSLSQVKFTIV